MGLKLTDLGHQGFEATAYIVETERGMTDEQSGPVGAPCGD